MSLMVDFLSSERDFLFDLEWVALYLYLNKVDAGGKAECKILTERSGVALCFFHYFSQWMSCFK